MQIYKEKGLRFYEDYENPREKCKAQKGAVRGKRTDKTFEYICAFGPAFYSGNCVCVEVLANVFKSKTPVLSLSSASLEYISENCRRIAKSGVPVEWMQAFNKYFE